MDILRKELNEFYATQRHPADRLPLQIPAEITARVEHAAALSGFSAVITDIHHDRSIFVPGQANFMLGLPAGKGSVDIIESSDEDFLYGLMHPADLADLRMLEYEYFKVVDSMTPSDKCRWRALADVRMKTPDGAYVRIRKSTQALALTPQGSLWLMLCGYAAPDSETDGTNPRLLDCCSGELRPMCLDKRRERVLTTREKEILRLIHKGLLSKEIALRLSISKNTVDRHRQNILEKLSVDNSMEAVRAATAMRLI